MALGSGAAGRVFPFALNSGRFACSMCGQCAVKLSRSCRCVFVPAGLLADILLARRLL